MGRTPPGKDRRQFGSLPTKVVDIDVAGPVRTIRGLGGYAFALVLVRLAGETVGTVRVPVHGDCCPGTVVAGAIADELSAALLRLHLLALLELPFDDRRLDIDSAIAAEPARDVTEARPAASPSLTVAVCTRDRAELLDRCLAGLRSVPPGTRVLIVDNAPSSQDSARMVARRYPEFDYVVEPRAGLDHARNRAIVETTTHLIAFTDDDVVVDRGWGRAVCRPFEEEPELAAVTGLVLPLELETPAQELFERLGGFGRGFVRRWETKRQSSGRARTSGGILGAGKFGTGANMAFRRSVFDRIGGFDPALDVGTPARGGGDLEMFQRVLSAGEVLRYEPAAVVFHQHRRTLAELERQIHDHGSQWAVMMAARAGRRASTADILEVLTWYATKHWPQQLLRASLIPNRLPLSLPLADVRGMAGAAVGRTYRRSRAVNPCAAPSIALDPPGREAGSRADARMEVATVDVAGPISLYALPPGTEAASVLVTRGPAAIGRLDMELAGRSPSDRQLRELIVAELGVRLLEECSVRQHDDVRQESTVRVAAALRQGAERETGSRQFSVSIVVATLDRPAELRECLASLRGHHTRHQVQIVVVDNDPGSGLTAPVVDAYPDVIYVAESRRGLAYARNSGFVTATGDILVTTDDDVRVPDGWLDLLLEPFERNDVMAVCGNVQPLELRHPAQRTFEAMGGLGKGFDRVESRWENPRSPWRAFRAWDLGAAANAAFRAEFRSHPEIGLMDEALGPGMPSGVGEDSYLLYRIARAGFTIVYQPAAFVYHHHRDQEEAFLRQITAYYSGHVAHNLTTLLRDRDLRSVARLARFAGFVTATRVRSILSREPLAAASARAMARGATAAPANYARSQRRVRRLGRV